MFVYSSRTSYILSYYSIVTYINYDFECSLHAFAWMMLEIGIFANVAYFSCLGTYLKYLNGYDSLFNYLELSCELVNRLLFDSTWIHNIKWFFLFVTYFFFRFPTFWCFAASASSFLEIYTQLQMVNSRRWNSLLSFGFWLCYWKNCGLIYQYT